jgi:hypothetical protein
MFTRKTLATASVRGTREIYDGTTAAPSDTEDLTPDSSDDAATKTEKEQKLQARKANIVGYDDLMTASNDDVTFFNIVNDATTVDLPNAVQERHGWRFARNLCRARKKMQQKLQQNIIMPLLAV